MGAALILSIVIALSGCAHGTITPSSPSESHVAGRIRAVTVTASTEIVPERLAVYRRMDGDELVAAQVVGQLNDLEVTDRSGDLEVEVTIEAFRLRSTGNAVWNGVLAGIDKLEGSVLVKQDDAEPVSYDFKLSGWEDGYFKYSSTARFKSLARELGRKIGSIIAE